MTTTMRSTEELIRIAQAGGGMELDAELHPVAHLVQIAQAAAGQGVKLILSNMEMFGTEDLIRIAQAGKGSVIFRDI